ncbi:uncharacterized protein VTP21DRAFT_81 [Calcarisporiella thermophila]|uniref:uncharacterized protein n=1 Tax=Calcarisporiella thermophila TaxID=911321 RepID=UPI003742B2BE
MLILSPLLLLFLVDASLAKIPLCIDIHNPLDLTQRNHIDCPLVHDLSLRQQSPVGSSSAFSVDLQCIASSDFCIKAKNNLARASEILAQHLSIKEPIRVSATFLPFCSKDANKNQDVCKKSGMMPSVGGALPARMLLLQDDDNMLRVYPQALVKQMDISPRPQFNQYDILMEFNSELPWHFLEDGPKLKYSNQTDFTHAVLHEMLHGLGFLSVFLEYPPNGKVLIPGGSAHLAAPSSGEVATYFEGVFEKYMLKMPERKPVSSYTQTIAAAAKALFSNRTTPEEMTTALSTSPEFQASRDLLKFATTKDALAILPFGGPMDDPVYLETSFAPLKAGSSLSHISSTHYANTSEWLMLWRPEKNLAYEEAVRAYGGPIGPKTLRVLASLGYKTKGNLPMPPIPILPQDMI